MDINEYLDSAVKFLIAFVKGHFVNLIVAAIIFGVVLVIQKLMGKGIHRIGSRLRLDDKTEKSIRNFFRFILWFLGGSLIFETLGLGKVLTHHLFSIKGLEINLYSVAISTLVIFGLNMGLGIIRQFITGLERRQKVDHGTGASIYLIIKYVLWVITITLVLQIVGVSISILLASLTALLVGIGFGLQQLFNDVVSGILLLFERNLKIKDVIQLDDGTVGKVTDIGLRTSKIKTRDDITMIIPNSKFVNERIINWSHNDWNTRFHIAVGVAYASDTDLVKKLLLECAHEHGQVSKNTKPFVRFMDFGESSLDFRLYFWVHDVFVVENIKSDLRFMVNRAFRENDVEIPFPQRDVHHYQTKG